MNNKLSFLISFNLNDLSTLYLNSDLQKFANSYYKASENPNDELIRSGIQDFQSGVKHLHNSSRVRDLA